MIEHWRVADKLSDPNYLLQQRNAFKSTAFVEVYIEASLDFNMWMFKLLKQYTKASYPRVRNTPNVTFDIVFKPLDGTLQKYAVVFSIRGSPKCSTFHALKSFFEV